MPKENSTLSVFAMEILKSVLFCSILAGSGQVYGLIDDGKFGTPSELFIAVLDPDAQVSYYKDLGVDMESFLKSPTGTFDLSQDPAFSKFLEKNNLIYNIAAEYPLEDANLSNLETWGYLATSSMGEGIFDSGFNSLANNLQYIQVYIDTLNPKSFTGTREQIAENLSGVLSIEDQAYFDTDLWGILMGGAGGGNTSGTVGQLLPFYHINNQTGEDVGTITKLGAWVLSADGKLTFSVGGENLPPVANAGSDQSVGQGAQVILDGSGSNDPDNGPAVLTYHWTQKSGATITLNNVDTPSPSFKATAAGVYRFTLTVSDGSASAEDEVQITVADASQNLAPIANAGNDQTVEQGSVVMLDGSESNDPDAAPLPLSFVWTQTDGTAIVLSGAESATPSFLADQAGTYTFSLTVSDGQATSKADSVTITVQAAAANQPPVANAGADRNVNVGTLVALDGSGSSDPDEGPSPLSFSWVQTDGETLTLTGSDTPTPTFTADQAGTYRFELTVSDGVASRQDTVQVIVESTTGNQAPIADAGADQTVSLEAGDTVVLNGSASTDPDHAPSPLTYQWTQVAGAAVVLIGADTASPTFAVATIGDYIFQLTVSDGAATSEDTVLVHVESGSGDVPPSASAGTDQTVNVGTPVILDGGLTTGSGPLTYAWTQTGGPVEVALAGRNSREASLIPPKAGLYTFQLAASNALGHSEDSVQINARAVGPSITLMSPEVWRSKEKQVVTWESQEISPRRKVTLFYAKDGQNFKSVKKIKLKKGKIKWKPKKSDVTDQGVLRICVKPKKKSPPVCDSVGIVVQP
jgi:hypothetical protein